MKNKIDKYFFDPPETAGAIDLDFYEAGYLAALEAFAWWKDGEMFVGNCGTKRSEVIAHIAKRLDHLREELE